MSKSGQTLARMRLTDRHGTLCRMLSSRRKPALLATAYASISVVYREVAKFGAVGLVAFVVDFGVFNLVRNGVIGELSEKPLTAKTISVVIATIVAWVGNRYWTFRHRRRASRRREFAMFGIMNAGGLAISLACLAFSHYVLGLTSALADNIAGNVIGLGLGTLFRFWAYRRFVFTQEQGFTEEIGVDTDGRLHTGEIPAITAAGPSQSAGPGQSVDVDEPVGPAGGNHHQRLDLTEPTQEPAPLRH